ncbi:phosphatidylinositol-3-phosphatase myotubularin-1-like [Hordeum vulgare]|nr:phosphatidylinositol-3-phosphatase myotubularin-1-like [Hordeum vulgare]
MSNSACSAAGAEARSTYGRTPVTMTSTARASSNSAAQRSGAASRKHASRPSDIGSVPAPTSLTTGTEKEGPAPLPIEDGARTTWLQRQTTQGGGGLPLRFRLICHASADAGAGPREGPAAPPCTMGPKAVPTTPGTTRDRSCGRDGGGGGGGEGVGEGGAGERGSDEDEPDRETCEAMAPGKAGTNSGTEGGALGGWAPRPEWPPARSARRTETKQLIELIASTKQPDHEERTSLFDGIRLRNTNDNGTLLVTNFQFLFMSKETKSKLGTIPLTTVEQIKEQDARSFEIIGHDMRLLVFDLKSEQKQELSKIVEYLTRCAKPSRLVDLFAFALNSTPPALANRTSPNMRLLKEYQRLFCKWFPPGTGFEIQKSLEDKWWRVTEANSDYSLCSTYPSHLIVPRTISDEELQVMSTSRALSRLPVISWCDFGACALVLFSRSPNFYVEFSRNIIQRFFHLAVTSMKLNYFDCFVNRKLYIVDARPRICSESACSYPESEVVYLGIEDIYEMRGSFSSLRKYIDTHGSISSNGLPLAGPVTGDLVNHGSAWGRGTINSMTKFSIREEWLNHIQIILIGGSWIAEKIAHESASVLVHCSDGWDRTTQLVGLASLLLDPFYRTFTGFQALVEKDWLAFGHQFAERMGLPTLAKGGQPENPSVKSQASDNKTSPVLLQWLECIAQLMRMYPSAFEFSSVFLVDFIDAVLSCRFGNFLCNRTLRIVY